MTTPRTGRPEGRPKTALREDPYRHALAFSYACQAALKMKAEQSYLLAAAIFLSKDVAYPSADMISDKLRRKFEMLGGTLVSSELIHRGRRFEGRNQATNTLRSKANRYVSEGDAYYLKTMAKMFFFSVFGKGDVVKRAKLIRDLSMLIGEEQIAIALILGSE
jgi:hypothetical protein